MFHTIRVFQAAKESKANDMFYVDLKLAVFRIYFLGKYLCFSSRLEVANKIKENKF